MEKFKNIRLSETENIRLSELSKRMIPWLYNCGVNEESSSVKTRFNRFGGEIVEWLIYARDFLVSSDK